MTVAGVLTGSGQLGAKATHPVQAIGSVPKTPDWVEPAAWRAARPWSPESRSIRVSTNRPVWIVSDVPPLQDLRITRDNPSVCMGLYRLNGSIDESIAGAPERIATTCAEGELLYTTPTDERIGVAVWTSDAETQNTALEIAWR